MPTEYKIFCINCGSDLKNIPVKDELALDCEVCGFSYQMLRDDLSETNFGLEIGLNKNPEETFRRQNVDGDFKLFCPFCKTDLKRKNFEEEPLICKKCKRGFSLNFY